MDKYDQCSLYIVSTVEHSASGDLFTHGIYGAFDNIDLFMSNLRPSSCIVDLFVRGVTIAPPESGELARPIDWLLRVHDHHPQIIGTFETSANVVNIQIWDVTNGQNTAVAITASGCYQIGDTGRWGWSTANLPTVYGHARQYFYIMISDATETFDGQFFLELPEKAKWIYPDDQDEYLMRI